MSKSKKIFLAIVSGLILLFLIGIFIWKSILHLILSLIYILFSWEMPVSLVCILIIYGILFYLTRKMQPKLRTYIIYFWLYLYSYVKLALDGYSDPA